MAEAVKVDPLAILENNEEVEFFWGKKKGLGGKMKRIQFYESFTYDGVEYALHDSVYMHKEGELPYIGKLIKIWENPDKSRKIKVHWFFRPSEILYHLKDAKVAENEIFLASGEGIGLANVNPLEAIVGKCNVVCISEDKRNPQPSEDEIKMADYVFYRAFDVAKCAILDKLDGEVGGLDVTCVFNRKESQMAGDVLKIASDQKDNKNAMELKPHDSLGTAKPSHLIGKSDVDAQSSVPRQDTLQRDANVVRVKQESTKKENSAASEQNLHDDSGIPKAAGKSSNLTGKSDTGVASSPRQDAIHGDANDSRIEQQSTVKGSPAPVQIVNSKTATTAVLKQNTSSEENVCRKDEKDDKKVSKPPSSVVKSGERGKPPKDAGNLDDRPLNRVKVNGSVTQSEDKGVNSGQNSTVCRNDKKIVGTSALSPEETKKSGDSKLPGGLDKNIKIRKDSASLDNRPLKKAKVDSLKIKEGREKSKISTIKPDDNLGNLPKVSATSPKDVERMQDKNFGTSAKELERTPGKSFEVTRRPVSESSKWFKAPPWEEVMQTANELGALILVENLNPEYTSAEVEDIIWHACKEYCTAKMLQRTAFSSPYSGRAFVAFKTREAAGRVTRKLDDRCLMMSNQRPLVASFVALPKTDGNAPSFAGHLCVDKLKLQLQREVKEAVSTSHCSQPNTIEYEMALEWCLLQSRSDSWGSRLYKQQKEEIRNIASQLKRK